MDQKTLVQQCAEYIRAKIIHGEYLPGKRLAVTHLAKEIQTGPTPVREALSRLSQTGLVEVFENQGFRVASLSEYGIRDLYQTFYQIEDLALSQAIDQGGDEWEGQIVAALYQLSLIETDTELQLEQYPLWAERNQQFHAALVNGCGSPCLLQIRNQLFMQFDRYIRLSYLGSQSMPIHHGDHTALADAVLNRDKRRTHALFKHQTLQGMDAMILKLKANQILK